MPDSPCDVWISVVPSRDAEELVDSVAEAAGCAVQEDGDVPFVLEFPKWRVSRIGDFIQGSKRDMAAVKSTDADSLTTAAERNLKNGGAIVTTVRWPRRGEGVLARVATTSRPLSNKWASKVRHESRSCKLSPSVLLPLAAAVYLALILIHSWLIELIPIVYLADVMRDEISALEVGVAIFGALWMADSLARELRLPSVVSGIRYYWHLPMGLRTRFRSVRLSATQVAGWARAR